MDTNLIHQSVISSTRFTFCRSGGKGGQNVNKVNTKVRGILAVKDIEGLSEAERVQAVQKLSGKINADGEICISVEDERTQELNKSIALRRLEDWIVNAAKILPKRHKTKPTKASKERRLKGKKIRSNIKKLRGRIL